MIEHVRVPSDIKFMEEVWDDLPHDAVLNKQVTGCGATTLALTNDEPYIVAVPYVALIENKAAQHLEVLGVYSGIKDEEIARYLVNGGKKIMITYDSLFRLSDFLDLKDWRLMVDESHMLLLFGATFKPGVVHRILSRFGEFKSTTFVSATPGPVEYMPVEMQRLRQVQMTWEGAKSISIRHAQVGSKAVRDRVLQVAIDSLDTDERPYFFYNSLGGIVAAIKDLRKIRPLGPDKIKIICANTEENRKYLEQHLGKDFQPATPLGTECDINFVTSFGFFGMDFYDENATTWVVSDLKGKGTHYDIGLALPQIVGRFRKQINPTINFIWTTRDSKFDLPRGEYENRIRSSVIEAQEQLELAAKNKRQRNLLTKTAKHDPYFLTDDDGSIQLNDLVYNGEMAMYEVFHQDYLTINNHGEHSRIIAKLRDCFGEVDTLELPTLSPEDKVALGSRVNWVESCRAYVDAKANPDEDESKRIIAITESDDRLRLIVNAYNLLGPAKLIALGCRKGPIEREFAISSALNNDPKVVRAHLRLKTGRFYSNEVIRQRLTELYKALGIKKQVVINHVSEWYRARVTTKKGVHGYRIEGVA